MQTVPSSSAGDEVIIRLIKHVEALIASISPREPTYVLALSGGLDSCVLLDILTQIKPRPNLQVAHVHHGLSPNADDWGQFCEDLCQKHGIPFHLIKVQVPKDSGTGIEAAARQLRYEALRTVKHDYILLAHHQDDQAETLLIQLSRGAGLKGLAGMPLIDPSKRLLRPLLNIPRDALAEYAVARKLAWVDDESNLDTAYDRNFYRHAVLPVMVQRYPAIRQTLVRSAAHIAEASLLLEEVAQQDAMQYTDQQGALNVHALRSISMPRLHNLLRWWLHHHTGILPTEAGLANIYRQLFHASDDADIKIAVDFANAIYIRRYRGHAYVERNSHEQALPVIWQGEKSLAWAGGTLVFRQASGAGIALARLGDAQLTIKSREGGERFRPHPKRPLRTLKHLLQEAGIPPSRREQLPLVYAGNTLVAVPGIGVAVPYQAQQGEAGLQVTWSAN
jgi:tRNA(Ile)-lysidine synthase